MHRIVSAVALSSLCLLWGLSAHAAPKRKSPLPVAPEVKRPPKAVPSIARREIEDGPVVVTMSQPGSAEVVVALGFPLGRLAPKAALAAAWAAFPLSDDAVARGVTRTVRVERGVVSIVDRAASAELSFLLFSFAAGVLGPEPTASDVAAAKVAAVAPFERGAPGALTAHLGALVDPADSPASDDAVKAAVGVLRTTTPAIVVTGDADIARTVELVERHFAARPAKRVRVSATPSAPSARARVDGPSGVAWLVDAAEPDPAAELALFAVRHRLGVAPVEAAGAMVSLHGFFVPGPNARAVEARITRALADVEKDGPTADEIGAFRHARESEALARSLFDWAARLAVLELTAGDARVAGRELSRVWEVDQERAKRAFAGPLAASHRRVVIVDGAQR